MPFKLKEAHLSFGGTQGVYTHTSSAVSGEMELSVYVPPQADTLNTGEKLPVLFYLSGLTCTQENVTGKGGFQQTAAELGLIIVCPDTSPRCTGYAGEDDDYDFGSGAGFYLNATESPWSETYKMYDYIVDELPALIAENFPIDTDRMGVFGHSMGGHGALTIGLRNPDLFKSISAFSPIVAPSLVPWGQKAFTGYLGKNTDAWAEYDATALMKAGHRSAAEILIDQGTADPFLAEHLQPELFAEACVKANQPLQVRMQAGYDHSYFFISSFMADHLQHHAKTLMSG